MAFNSLTTSSQSFTGHGAPKKTRMKTHCFYFNLNDQKTSHFYWCIPGMLGTSTIPKYFFWNCVDAFWDNPIYPPRYLNKNLDRARSTLWLKDYCLLLQINTSGTHKKSLFMEGLKSAISAFLKNCQIATFMRMSFQQTDSKLFTNQIFFWFFFSKIQNS